MKTKHAHRVVHWTAMIYILIWTVANRVLLIWFPRVHSDEAWLAGLSKAYLDAGSLSVTEPFFDLFPRQAHAFKSLFHLLQALFIARSGFSVDAVRQLSLLSGLMFLTFLYIYLIHAFGTSWMSVLYLILTSWTPIFLTSAHVARQEIILLAFLPVMFSWLDRAKDRMLPLVLTGLLTGLGAMIHPNALFLAAMIGAVILYRLFSKSLSFRQFIAYWLALGLAGGLLILLTLSLSPDFFRKYAEFGSSLSISASPVQRLKDFYQFFRLIWREDTGTYWLPDLRTFLTGSVIIQLMSLVVLAKIRLGHHTADLAAESWLIAGWLTLAAYLLALFVIGRYNPTSILFLLWPVLLSACGLTQLFIKSWPVKFRAFQKLAIAAGLACSLYAAFQMIEPFLPVQAGELMKPLSQENTYVDYEQQIASELSNNSVVLGNLSAGFVLENKVKAFYDMRNLAFLDADHLRDSLAEYLHNNQITTVIWYEEYDYILRNPDWWVLYETRQGHWNQPDVLLELKKLLDEQGICLKEFESTDYGTRIVRYQGDYPWKVSLYQLQP